jgi:small subunit ribosomal protein S18
VDKIDAIDYKDTDKLKRALSDRFMIEARRKSGVCSKHQRLLARAVKRARQLSLIPFTSSHKGSFVINFRPRN